MGLIIYRNKRTFKKVFAIDRKGDLLHVQYIPSGMKCWYTIEDFKKLFEKVE